MKKLIITLLFVIPLLLHAQDGIRVKVPKQISLETGYRRILQSEMTNQASNGYTVLLDYAWQLSGFTGKRASFLSVPLGYTYMLADTDTARSVRVISYGWTVRHELTSKKNFVPYLGYALMLNNYAEKGIDGHRFAHQTRFSLGVNKNGPGAIQPYVQLDYTMSFYPVWGIKGSQGYSFIELKLGARYLRSGH